LEVSGSTFDGSNNSLKLQTLNIKQISMNKITTYFRESYKELMEKVTWPTWTQLQQSTMIVIAATLVITALVAGMDFITNVVLNQIYKIF
jgi:preprotein translocase subunit SecE